MTTGLVGVPTDVEPSTAVDPVAPLPATRSRPFEPRAMSTIRFWLWMGGVGVIGALIQTLFIHAVSKRLTVWPGARYIAQQAAYLIRGQWFVAQAHAHAPGSFHADGATLIPTALHPPLPTVLIAISDVASISGSTLHMIFLALLFGISGGLVGVTVRNLVGGRAGILAALIFVTFPLLWVNPATLGAETVVIAICSLLLFVSVRFWNHPSLQNAVVVGFSLGLAALTRTDLIGLVVLLALPLALLVRNTSWLGRLRYLAVIAVLCALVVSPWVIRNQVHIGHSAVLSNDSGPVLAGANCSTTSTGPLEGWWSAQCLPSGTAATTETKANRNGVHLARVYVSHHLGDEVGMAAVRLGRLWNVYRPLQGVQLEQAVGRPAWVSRLGLWYFYVLVPVAVGGAAILRRRRVLLFPLAATILLSSITAVLAYGDARFAVEADVALAMLGGVALDATPWTGRHRGRSRGRHTAGRPPETVSP
jgi:4-amino-4-deoxy-L-arabinose transferase-like glycosyltransferase